MAATPTTATSRFWHPFADMGAVSQRELLIERGEGVWVYDADDHRYLDGTASLWYANIGHGNREVAERVAAQMARLEAYSTFGDFGNRPANELAERLAANAPMDGARVFLTSVVFGLVILVLLIRPNGLFSRRRATAERV